MIKLWISLIWWFVLQGPPAVHVAGSMRKVMQQHDLTAAVAIDTLVQHQKHIFGLGPAENLEGEIMILDSKVYATHIDGHEIQNYKDQPINAAFLAYAKVNRWQTLSIKTPLEDMKALEDLLALKIATKNWTGAVPFQIKSKHNNISSHIIDWRAGEIHRMDNHKQFAKNLLFNNEDLILFGFYSTEHAGIIIHHTARVHVHALQTRTQNVSHVDQLKLLTTFDLLLPE